MTDIEDSFCRKWQITINNPIPKGYTHEVIKEKLQEFKKCIYWCMADEEGETFHTHIYMCCSSIVRFSSIIKRFKGGHFEMAKGTSAQNRDYVFKEGKWANTEKETTNFKDSHEEWGELPVERQGKRNDLDDLYDMIKAGMSNYEIIENSPQYMLHVDKIERVRQSILDEKYKDVWRNIHCTYIFGSTGAGKSRSVMDKFGYSNVYRVTDYLHPFDSYKGQSVIIFEEFRSSLKIDDLLKFLDGYPLELPCRYANRQACFTEVYFATNIPLLDQYPNIQTLQQETWHALLRRIHEVHIYDNGNIYKMSLSTYMDGFYPTEVTPFGDENLIEPELPEQMELSF